MRDHAGFESLPCANRIAALPASRRWSNTAWVPRGREQEEMMTTANQWSWYDESGPLPDDFRHALALLADQAEMGIKTFGRLCHELDLALRRALPGHTERYLKAIPMLVERSRRRHERGIKA